MTTPWLATSPADYDKRLAVRGHKRDDGDQGSLFYVPTPTREAKPGPAREELPGQVSLDDLLGTGADGCSECAAIRARAPRITDGEIADVHAVSHACPCCGGHDLVILGPDCYGSTRCECNGCPAQFTCSADVTGPVALRYIHVGHKAR